MSDNQNYARIKELEAEINSDSTQNTLQPEIVTEGDAVEASGLNSLTAWFQSLPDVGKIAVAAVAVIVSFSVLNAVLKLVTSLLTVAILAAILYGLYKVWLAPRT